MMTDAIDQYRRGGYTVARGPFKPDEAAALRERHMELRAQGSWLRCGGRRPA